MTQISKRGRGSVKWCIIKARVRGPSLFDVYGQTVHIWSVMTLKRPTFRPTEKGGSTIWAGPHRNWTGPHLCVSASGLHLERPSARRSCDWNLLTCIIERIQCVFSMTLFLSGSGISISWTLRGRVPEPPGKCRH